MGAFNGYAQELLSKLGAPATANNVAFLNAWAKAEGGNASYNPFNTTQPAPGASNYNSVGVRNYTSPQQGISATIQTLLNGRYGNIVQGLRSGATPQALATAVANSPWGTGSGVLRVLGDTPVSSLVNAAWGDPKGGGGKAGQGQAGLPPMPPSGGNNFQLYRQMLVNQMMQGAADTISGKIGSGSSANLMNLAMLRSQLGAAQNTYGTSPAASAASPTVHGGWAGKSLDGNVSMVAGGKSPFSNLRFANGVDWQHVNPRLLKSINSVAAAHGKVVDIISGYRSNQHSNSVGGFAGDPHTKGLAVDASVNGQPIGNVFGPGVWSGYGVRSGNVPNFYQGKPDPGHLDLLGA
jgi:hypothetical protein